MLLSAEIIWDMVYMSDSTHLFASYRSSFRRFLEPINFSQINHYLSRKAVPREIWIMWTKMKELLDFDTEKKMDYQHAAKTVNYVSRAIWECSRKSAWMTTECFSFLLVLVWKLILSYQTRGKTFLLLLILIHFKPIPTLNSTVVARSIHEYSTVSHTTNLNHQCWCVLIFREVFSRTQRFSKCF